MPLALTEDAIGMRRLMPSTPTGKIEKDLVLVPYYFIGSNTSLIESSENGRNFQACNKQYWPLRFQTLGCLSEPRQNNV